MGEQPGSDIDPEFDRPKAVREISLTAELVAFVEKPIDRFSHEDVSSSGIATRYLISPSLRCYGELYNPPSMSPAKKAKWWFPWPVGVGTPLLGCWVWFIGCSEYSTGARSKPQCLGLWEWHIVDMADTRRQPWNDKSSGYWGLSKREGRERRQIKRDQMDMALGSDSFSPTPIHSPAYLTPPMTWRNLILYYAKIYIRWTS